MWYTTKLAFLRGGALRSALSLEAVSVRRCRGLPCLPSARHAQHRTRHVSSRLTSGALKSRAVIRPTLGDRSRILGAAGGDGAGFSGPVVVAAAGDSRLSGSTSSTRAPLAFVSPVPPRRTMEQGFGASLLKACLQ